MNINAFFALLLASTLLITLPSVQAQTIYEGDGIINKVLYPGLHLTLQGEGKQIEKDWVERLKTYGRLTNDHDAYHILNADIPAISSEPIQVISSLKLTKTSTTIFISFDLGNKNYVQKGTNEYEAAERLLNDFASTSLYQQEIRLAEGTLSEAKKNQQKTLKKGDQLQRSIEQNAKEKERLLKRLDDNAKELDQLKKDIETNKIDQQDMLSEVDNHQKNLDAVKAKKQ